MFGILVTFGVRFRKPAFVGTESLKQAWHGCLHPSVQSECCSSKQFRQKWCPQLSVTTLPCTASHFRHFIRWTSATVAISPDKLKTLGDSQSVILCKTDENAGQRNWRHVTNQLFGVIGYKIVLTDDLNHQTDIVYLLCLLVLGTLEYFQFCI